MDDVITWRRYRAIERSDNTIEAIHPSTFWMFAKQISGARQISSAVHRILPQVTRGKLDVHISLALHGIWCERAPSPNKIGSA
jgi:hypothetical protein